MTGLERENKITETVLRKRKSSEMHVSTVILAHLAGFYFVYLFKFCFLSFFFVWGYVTSYKLSVQNENYFILNT